MTTIVAKLIGTSGGDYSLLQSWEDVKPTDLTLTRSNTTQAGSTSSTIVLDASASATTDFYVGHAVSCDARPAEKRLITAYNGTTKVATISALNGSAATWGTVPGTEAFTVDATIWEGQVITNLTITSNRLTVSGSTTSSTAFTRLRAGVGLGWADNASKATNPIKVDSTVGVTLTCAYNYGPGITVSEANFQMSGLQYSGTSGGQAVNFSAVGSVDHCIFEGVNTSAPMVSGYKFYNCVFLARRSSTTAIVQLNNGSSEMRGCTLACPSDFATRPATGILSTYGFGLLENVGIFGCTGIHTGTAGTKTTCFTDIASPPAGFTQTTFSTAFVGTTDSTRNLRPVSGSGLINAGTVDATYLTDDALGVTRSGTPTVGAIEYVSGGTNATGGGGTGTGTGSGSGGAATGGSGGAGSAAGGTGTSTGSGSGGTATGAGAGTFTSDAMENNTGAGLLASIAVAWTWYQGAIGAAPTSTTHGTGTTNTSGVLTASGLPSGAGFLLVRTADSTGVYYYPGTVT